ncbi:MAG: rod shape-determining protein, partial [Acidaminococcales bacterium]|nr:rod shape-determining protein [Acidaminococcales bacterium]
ALDIGTRSVVGIVAEKEDKKINIIAVDRQEHITRAMLDGQIHDVPQVAHTIGEVRDRLAKKTGYTLAKASVAAAGRALITITASSDLDTANILSLDTETEQMLVLSAVQTAQRGLAADSRANDPTGYYCVGYSVIEFKLDGSRLSTLIGQRGRVASVTIIATFLPRPVIDSMQSALSSLDLEIGTITLEPIAAINVLIPPTMRHLNLTLVDIGAGTSDVAVTSGGSVIGFGMVPCAGDEVTEALSQKYLLDFNVAEKIKRQLNDKPKKIEMHDVLGGVITSTPKEILDSICPTVRELAGLIVQEILSLNNNNIPQAILLIGGGALTPMLQELIAETIGMPPEKVAIRLPSPTLLLPRIPDELYSPEAITPLGILCLSNSDHLNFITIRMNKQVHRLFNLGSLKISDALLSSNIDVNSIKGRPGLGITVEVNGQTKFIPGTYGAPGSLELNGKPATLDDKLKDGDKLKVVKGVAGKPPKSHVLDVVDCSNMGNVYINGKKHPLAPAILLNGEPAGPSSRLSDRDKIEVLPPDNIGRLLDQLDIDYEDDEFEYTVNKNIIGYKSPRRITLNGQKAGLTSPVKPGDVIDIEKSERPTLEQLLALDAVTVDTVEVSFNGRPVRVARTFKEFTVNDKTVKPSYIPKESDAISFKVSKKIPNISDVLLAGEFDPQKTAKEHKNVEILLNGEKTEFTAPVKSGDQVTVRGS